ncbi:phenylacetate--CoA ligase family protein [Flavobacterium agrisoli]|uniref:Phenylacetate--CoA ligase family protein n=1 Tax=Flavobacterium agrisoli TaxID=2793066 RepID=A0A934PK25_9FLAO|nr:phenylacetate--CoA ligase family protein [Flavobacterium agrisoli]MBK0369612.1 phenylacetate--CoA ligase family protein [Flavobacterium agrisoli]
MFALFDVSLQLNGFPINKAKSELQHILNLSEPDYLSFLDRKKKKIVAFHFQNNPFYKKVLGETVPENWQELPVLSKSDLQQPLLNRLSKGFTKQNCFVNKTSGSSGTPFIFAKDKYSHALTWASNMLRFGWHGIDFNHSYQARFYGMPRDSIGYQKERLKDFLSHRYRFPVFDLSDTILEGFLDKFRTQKFDYINGYTSSIVLFAKFLQQKNIVLKSICPTLKVCIVTSEMLFENDRILLENQLGIPIVNEYGASELDLIAFENPQGEWQVNAETLFVEILDENNQAVPYGMQGKVVITSLFNTAHPFIRYEIGDIGILDEKSTPQKPILKKLIGRTNDFALLPSGKKAPGLTFYYITKSIIEDNGNVKEFVIKQTKINTFEVDYVSEIELNLTQIQKIEAAIALYLEKGLIFTFVRKEKLERSKSGKLKQFVSLIKEKAE